MRSISAIVVMLLLLASTARATRVAVIRDDDAPLYSKAVLGIGVELEDRAAPGTVIPAKTEPESGQFSSAERLAKRIGAG